MKQRGWGRRQLQGDSAHSVHFTREGPVPRLPASFSFFIIMFAGELCFFLKEKMNAYLKVNNHFMIDVVVANQTLHILGKINSLKGKKNTLEERKERIRQEICCGNTGLLIVPGSSQTLTPCFGCPLLGALAPGSHVVTSHTSSKSLMNVPFSLRPTPGTLYKILSHLHFPKPPPLAIICFVLPIYFSLIIVAVPTLCYGV